MGEEREREGREEGKGRSLIKRQRHLNKDGEREERRKR